MTSEPSANGTRASGTAAELSVARGLTISGNSDMLSGNLAAGIEHRFTNEHRPSVI